jgi:hypothetical protein
MGGGLMQLVAYGAQDIYLTGNPQITFFKVVYRRHTNFSMEAIEQTINGSSSASGSGSVTVSRNGDLVYKVYVNSSDMTAGTDGTTLIDNVELEIGGQRIDKQTSEWNQIWHDLSTPDSKAAGFKCMIGACGNSNTNAVGLVQVPLNFWFCRNPGLALPLIALQYHEVKLKCVWGAAVGTRKVFCDYIYLDTDERRRFAQVSHEYLIEQVQEQSADTSGSFRLNFNHPVKELVWTSAATNSYGTAQLKLNGHDRFSAQEEEYFQLRQPLDYHTSVPGQNVVLYDRVVTPVVPIVLAANAAANDAADDAATLEITGAASGATIELGSNHVGTIAGQTTIRLGDILQVVNSIDGSTAEDDTEYYQCQVTAIVAGTNALTLTTVFDDPGSAITTTATTAVDSRVGITLVARAQDPLSKTGSLTKKINVYSFALKPEEHQPSGTCNFSRIDTAKLDIGTADGMGSSDNIYAVNYNVLRIMSGMGGLAYSN